MTILQSLVFSLIGAGLVMLIASPVFGIRTAEFLERVAALIRRHAGAMAGARATYRMIWRTWNTPNAGLEALKVQGTD